MLITWSALRASFVCSFSTRSTCHGPAESFFLILLMLFYSYELFFSPHISYLSSSFLFFLFLFLLRFNTLFLLTCHLEYIWFCRFVIFIPIFDVRKHMYTRWLCGIWASIFCIIRKKNREEKSGNSKPHVLIFTDLNQHFYPDTFPHPDVIL